MHVVQQLDVGAVILAQPLEQLRHDVEILRRGPHGLRAAARSRPARSAFFRFEMP